MLALRSKGLDVNDFKNKFSENWLKLRKNNFKELADRHLLEINDYTIRLTKSGYALCDEILNNIL
jgi:coproporphyrinogen III oxidase-like Fe-S oxidoreductase